MKSLALLVLLAAAPASALTYQRHVLKNGLVVLLYKDASAPLVSVDVWYKVGSKNERTGHTGFAHLFEHYMFECTQHIPEGGYFEAVLKRLGGEANAFTTNDKTNYYSVVPAGGLDEVLRLESDRMGYLQACLNQTSLDKQRAIVENEKRERGGAPYAGAIDALVDQTFSLPHPYHWPVIGSMQDLEAASLKDVKAFHDSYYLPNNAVIAIAGAIDEKTALERARFWFEGLKKGPTPPAAAVPPLDDLGGRRETTTTDDKAQMPMLVIGFPVPGRGKAGNEEASAISSILGDGRGARLEKALKQSNPPLAISVETGLFGLSETDLLLIQAIPAPGVTLPQLETAIYAELSKLAQGGVDPKELARLKAKMRTSFYDSLQNVEGVAQSLAEGEALKQDPNAFIDGEAAQIEALTPEALRAAARRLTPSNASVVNVVPAVRSNP
jgi:zinc protease